MSKIPEIRADKGDVIGVGVDGNGNIITKNFTLVVNQARGYGLTLIHPNHFKENSDTSSNFERWKNGFDFSLESIYYKREYRREGVLEEIQTNLEKQNRLLLLGESGTSKSTILMEVICHYFDKGYKVLHSKGDQEPKEPDDIAEFIRELVRGGNKVLVAIDNVHDKKMASVFYIIDLLQAFNKRENIIFLLSARQPEYKSLLDKGKFTIQDNYRHAMESLFVYAPDHNYEIKSFSTNEIIEFVTKYKEYLPENRRQKSIEENAKEIFDDTGGHPIMVKFSVIGEGLQRDVEDRYGRYLVIENERGKPDSNRIRTVVICSLFDISTLQITDELLEKIGILPYANDLDRGILYYSPNGTWKTLHARWDEELLAHIFRFNDKNLIKMMKHDFSNAIQSIFAHFNEFTILAILNTLYATIVLNKFVSIDIINSILPVIPDSFSDDFKLKLYTLIIGITHDNLGRYQEAIEWYDKALKIDPDYFYVLYNKGVALGNLDQHQKAIEWHDKALKIDPDDVYALNGKGAALGNLGRFQEAIECFDIALKIVPDDVYALNGKGLALYNLGYYQEAIYSYDKALKVDPNYVDALSSKAFALYSLRKYKQALDCYDKGLKINPNDVGVLTNKGLALGDLGKFKDEIDCYDKVLEIDPKYVKALNNKASALGNLGKYQEAVGEYDKVLKINPNYVSALGNKGYALFRLNKIDEAIQCSDKEIEIDSLYASAWYNRSCYMVKKGEINKALKDLEEAIRLDNTNMEFARTDKLFDSIRDNAKFKELVGVT